jgi:hypothetical protein
VEKLRKALEFKLAHGELGFLAVDAG